MDLQQLNEIDFNNVGDWPTPVKGVLVGVLCVLLVGAWYYFDTLPQWERLTQAEAHETELKGAFETKQKKAASLDAYKQQLAEMQESFGAMLRQLPNKTEVAALLVDVSQMGLAAGLEFNLFRPAGEVPKDFYAELPINIKVVGKFNDFGNFISGLAALPRIVTIHEITITASGKDSTGANQGNLLLEATAKTYRYLDEGPK